MTVATSNCNGNDNCSTSDKSFMEHLVIPNGTYKITYLTGATQHDPSVNWNQTYYADSTDWAVNFCYNGTSLTAPGYNIGSWSTEAAAEAACSGVHATITITDGNGLYGFFNNINNCGSGTGSITYSIEQIA